MWIVDVLKFPDYVNFKAQNQNKGNYTIYFINKLSFKKNLIQGAGMTRVSRMTHSTVGKMASMCPQELMWTIFDYRDNSIRLHT